MEFCVWEDVIFMNISSDMISSSHIYSCSNFYEQYNEHVLESLCQFHLPVIHANTQFSELIPIIVLSKHLFPLLRVDWRTRSITVMLSPCSRQTNDCAILEGLERDGTVSKNAHHTRVRTWVQILSTNIKPGTLSCSCGPSKLTARWEPETEQWSSVHGSDSSVYSMAKQETSWELHVFSGKATRDPILHNKEKHLRVCALISSCIPALTHELTQTHSETEKKVSRGKLYSMNVRDEPCTQRITYYWTFRTCLFYYRKKHLRK